MGEAWLPEATALEPHLKNHGGWGGVMGDAPVLAGEMKKLPDDPSSAWDLMRDPSRPPG